MKINVIYAQAKRQLWLDVDVPEGSTIQNAIDCSGILTQCPEIDLEQQKVGVFGKVSPLNTVLADGDRIEIYRALIADPKAIKKRANTENASAAAQP
ncbi:RnfH family protein [Chromatium weissei]|nr:RnfH family protein [Chromatium weissei]